MDYQYWNNPVYSRASADFPKSIDTYFPEFDSPIDAADAYAERTETSGPLYIIKSDVVYEYMLTAQANDFQVTFTKDFSISSTDNHVFNAIPQSPPQMPSGITALQTNKKTSTTHAFVGSQYYTHQWGTGIWTYQGHVLCFL